eukprot:1098086-Alexandrium_andersonii.AAC.1
MEGPGDVRSNHFLLAMEHAHPRAVDCLQLRIAGVSRQADAVEVREEVHVAAVLLRLESLPDVPQGVATGHGPIQGLQASLLAIHGLAE